MLQGYSQLCSTLCQGLNPFEVREVLQVIDFTTAGSLGLNPFEVREVLQDSTSPDTYTHCLNPFEVREVLQGGKWYWFNDTVGLNPFEVREVLQGTRQRQHISGTVSIPLKSGRCCKYVSV